MERLTEKGNKYSTINSHDSKYFKLKEKSIYDGYIFDKEENKNIDLSNNKFIAIQKLGYAEDIEEKHNMSIDEMDAYIAEHKKIEQELGIKLNVLFKALKNGIWYKTTDKGICFTSFVHVSFENIIFPDGVYLLKDYGKTWALTKKELE